MDMIDIRRKSIPGRLSRKDHAIQLDSLRKLHNETVTTMWDSWRKKGKFNWEQEE